MGRSLTNVGNPSSPMDSGRNGLDIAACGYFTSASFVRNYAMPNSLTTFNRYWSSLGTANDAPAALSRPCRDLPKGLEVLERAVEAALLDRAGAA